MLGVIALLAAVGTAPGPTATLPPAIYSDPAHDAQFPAGMEVLHIPSGGVSINGIDYLAAGSGPHPTLLLMHGLPGNEKNLDLAQAVRRAGWNVVTFNYRGSWGSPGNFSFAGNLEDARNVLAYLRRPEVASKLRINTGKIVIAGHSMGGWVTALIAEQDTELAGAILISAANMGGSRGTHAELVADMATDMETLATTTPEKMAGELEANQPRFDWMPRAARLASIPLLVLTSDDGLAPAADDLVKLVRQNPHAKVSAVHVATDHPWSDRRIRLESEVIRWLQSLR
jgi:pimeloyl-ACP methyl ester carboxylesterase